MCDWKDWGGEVQKKKKTPVTPENWDGTEGGKNAQLGHIMCITKSTAASSEVNRGRWGRPTVCILIFRGSHTQFHNVAELPSFYHLDNSAKAPPLSRTAVYILFLKVQ